MEREALGHLTSVTLWRNGIPFWNVKPLFSKVTSCFKENIIIIIIIIISSTGNINTQFIIGILFA